MYMMGIRMGGSLWGRRDSVKGARAWLLCEICVYEYLNGDKGRHCLDIKVL